MGFFEWLKDKLFYEEDDDDYNLSFGTLEGEDAESISKAIEKTKLRRDLNIHNKIEREQYVRHYCELMSGASDDVDLKRTDYQKITDRLRDIEEIEALPVSERNEIKRRAKAILDFEAEEAKYKRPVSKISDAKYREISAIESEMPDIIRRIKDNEDYQTLVKRDMNLLEGEKAGLAYDRKMSKQKAANAKAMFTISLVAGALAYVVIIMLSNIMYFEVKLPLIITTGLLAICFTAIFVSYRDAKDSTVKIQKQINRAISLQNTAKIKYVNITNAIDYSYSKYNINSSHELYYLWDKYIEEKEARNHSDNVILRMEQLRTELHGCLSRFRIADTANFVYNPQVLVYDEEMAALRHELVISRQKLRKGLDFESYNLDNYKKEIEDIVKQYPQYSKEILAIVEEYE